MKPTWSSSIWRRSSAILGEFEVILGEFEAIAVCIEGDLCINGEMAEVGGGEGEIVVGIAGSGETPEI